MRNFKNFALLFLGITILIIVIGIICWIIGIFNYEEKFTFVGTMLKTFKYYGIGLGLVVPVILAIKIFQRIDFD